MSLFQPFECLTDNGAITVILSLCVSCSSKYNTKNSEGILVNCLGVVLVALAAVMVYIITNPAYKRQPLPEEEQMQLTQ